MFSGPVIIKSVKWDYTYFDGVTESSITVDCSTKSGSKRSWPFLCKQKKENFIGLKLVLHNTWRTNPNDDYLITRKWELTKEAQRLHIDCYMIYMFLKLLQQKKTQTLNIIIAMIFCASCCCTNIVVPIYKIHIYSLFHLHLSRYITNQFNDSSQLHLDWWLNRPSALVDHVINFR